MNKKQLVSLMMAIVAATQKHQPGTTEDEARTLVGMALRKAATELIVTASGCDPEEATESLREAQEELAAEATAKKEAKKAKAAS